MYFLLYVTESVNLARPPHLYATKTNPASNARFSLYKKAAEMLYISQPALSQSLAKLESDLGVKLFERHGNRMILTEALAASRNPADAAKKLGISRQSLDYKLNRYGLK